MIEAQRTGQIVRPGRRRDRTGPVRPGRHHDVPARPERGGQDHRGPDADHPAAARTPGWARVAGHDVVTGSRPVRRHIGLSGQYASVDECLTGRANLVMIGELSRLPRRAARQRAADLLARFELEEAAGRAVRTYSGGMRRRLDLAASLLGQPSVLFLDEPTTGLDPRQQADLVAHHPRTWSRRAPPCCSPRSTWRRPISSRTGSASSMEGGSPPRGPRPSSKAGDRCRAPAPGHLRPRGAGRAAADPGPPRGRPGPAARRGSGLEVPVTPRAGLVTEVVRALDAAGIAVDDVALRQPDPR